ncbi:MAG TPA: DUF4349 domain-containing protein [Anaerolineaceae bacterium]|nr:DUF4349 domain-containing protein [Anaerolineaceae bacterium]
MKKAWNGIVILLALVLSACSAAQATPAPGAPAAPPPLSQSLGKSVDSNLPQEAAPGAPSKSGSGANAAAIERLVVKTANLTIVVPDPPASLDAISQMANRLEGYVVTSNSYKTRTDDGREIPEASITMRVPAAKLNDALSEIKRQVKDARTDVLIESVTGEDVTQQYTDLQSRLKNQQAAEAQLREIMASATRPEDVMNIFNQLTQVREQIEVLQGQIKYYEESAAMSAITVQLKAEESVAPVSIGSWQPVGVARDAVQALIATLKFLVGVAIYLVLLVLPVAIIIYIPLRLIWLGVRRWRNSRKNKEMAVPPASSNPPASS